MLIAFTCVRRFAGVPIWLLLDDNGIGRYAFNDMHNRWACVRQFIGIPICCVGRWNLIRRNDGNRLRFCTSICTTKQSVVLDVGIWYARMMVIDSPAYDQNRKCSNLLCWTLESDTPNNSNRFACDTLIQLMCQSVGWTLESDTPIYGDRFACVANSPVLTK